MQLQSFAQGRGELEQSTKPRCKSVPVQLTSFPAESEEGLGLILWESQVQETDGFSGVFLTYFSSPAGETQTRDSGGNSSCQNTCEIMASTTLHSEGSEFVGFSLWRVETSWLQHLKFQHDWVLGHFYLQ